MNLFPVIQAIFLYIVRTFQKLTVFSGGVKSFLFHARSFFVTLAAGSDRIACKEFWSASTHINDRTFVPFPFSQVRVVIPEISPSSLEDQLIVLDLTS